MKKASRVLMILFCIPFLCSFFMKKEETDCEDVITRTVSLAGFEVLAAEETGTFLYDPEEILPYLVAAILPQNSKEQLLEAAAIVCRTNLIKTWEQEQKPSKLDLSKTGLNICKRTEYRKLLSMTEEETATDFIRRAVKATQGIILTYEGETIEAPFFYLSAGSTRDAGECFAEGKYPYLKAKECTEDLRHAEYLKQYDIPKEEFYVKLMKIMTGVDTKAVNLKTDGLKLEDFTINREEKSGYVKTIQYEREKLIVDAAAFCNTFDLCSPCFSLEERDGDIMISTKGIGHGIGLDLYYAAYLAEQGKNYYEILRYFYSGADLEKIYNTAD